MTGEEAITYILNFAEEENNDSYQDLKDLVWEDIDMEVERDAIWGPRKKKASRKNVGSKKCRSCKFVIMWRELHSI